MVTPEQMQQQTSTDLPQESLRFTWPLQPLRTESRRLSRQDSMVPARYLDERLSLLWKVLQAALSLVKRSA